MKWNVPSFIVSVLPSSVVTSSISSVPEWVQMPAQLPSVPLNRVVPPPSPNGLTRPGRFGSTVTAPFTSSVAFDCAKNATAPV